MSYTVLYMSYTVIHGVTEWFALQGTLKSIQFQSHCHGPVAPSQITPRRALSNLLGVGMEIRAQSCSPFRIPSHTYFMAHHDTSSTEGPRLE